MPKKRSLEQQEVDLLNANVRELMNSRQGKEVMWQILSYCGMYSSYPGDFEAGKRQVGLDVMQMLDDADLTIYPNLLLENRKDA